MKTARLQIDYASSARPGTLMQRVWLGLAVAAFAACIALLGQVLNSNTSQTQRLAALKARSATPVAKAPPKADMSPGEAARARAVRQTAQKLVTPWSEMLASLETAPTKSVALIAVEPSVSKRTVRVTAEARSLTDMLDYLAAMQADTRMSDVVLVSHQIQTQTPGTPVRFLVQAGWGPAP